MPSPARETWDMLTPGIRLLYANNPKLLEYELSYLWNDICCYGSKTAEDRLIPRGSYPGGVINCP